MAVVCETYTPSDLDTQRFWDVENARKKESLDVPAGLPKKLNSPLAWIGADIESKQSEWKLDLTDDEIAAIDAALAGFEGWSRWKIYGISVLYIGGANRGPIRKPNTRI